MIVSQELTRIYLEKENWHKSKLSEEESNKYHERLLVQGNILTYIKDNKLIGYLEIWRINYEQLGRIICGVPILTDKEDIVSGNIAYVNNMYINEEERNGDVFDILLFMFLEKNKDAEYFCAMRRLKHHHPIQVYNREELIKMYNKKG